ncbi:NADH-quinone oxidoreductase subunit K [Caldivirga sp.]|uniref:NADH-quinone oxidoreductase subunit K n=1 Tax=Caldivirga sp. TaxID=2080243 RepID=UPI0025BAAD04|nr:NADH-quinone oxidoreductase subunit K [Caldivirga sp.]
MIGESLSLIVTAILILSIGLTVVINSRDLIRLLIGLELMFNSIFLTAVALYVYQPYLAFIVVTVSVITSAAEFIALITAILTIDRMRKNIETRSILAGGDKS